MKSSLLKNIFSVIVSKPLHFAVERIARHCPIWHKKNAAFRRILLRPVTFPAMLSARWLGITVPCRPGGSAAVTPHWFKTEVLS